MPLAGRLVAGAIVLVVVIAVAGCATTTDTRVATLERENATLRSQISDMSIELAGARTRETAARSQAEQMLTQKINTARVMNAYANRQTASGSTGIAGGRSTVQRMPDLEQTGCKQHIDNRDTARSIHRAKTGTTATKSRAGKAQTGR